MRKRLEKEKRYQSGEKIIIESHNPKWIEAFSKEAKKIKTALGSNCIEVHHIGSTKMAPRSILKTNSFSVFKALCKCGLYA